MMSHTVAVSKQDDSKACTPLEWYGSGVCLTHAVKTLTFTVYLEFCFYFHLFSSLSSHALLVRPIAALKASQIPFANLSWPEIPVECQRPWLTLRASLRSTRAWMHEESCIKSWLHCS